MLLCELYVAMRDVVLLCELYVAMRDVALLCELYVAMEMSCCYVSCMLL